MADEWTSYLVLAGVTLVAMAVILRPRAALRARRRPGGAHVPDDEDQDGDQSLAPADALVIDGELDLHHFQPREVPKLVQAYVEDCARRGVLQLRIVHGKGRGTLRRSVHAVLARLPEVRHFELAPPHRGGWGATMVDLHAGFALDPD